MSDTSTPTPPAGDPPKKKKLTRSAPGNNKKILDELTKAEQIALAAKKPVYAVKLALRDIDDAEDGAAPQLLDNCNQARKKCADTLQSNTSKEGATKVEELATKRLIAGLQEVQAAAKQKYMRTTPVFLQDYYVGEHLNGSRSRLEQVSAAILEKLDTDTLPGITVAKKAALTALRGAWINADSTQTDEKTEVGSELQEVHAIVKAIQNERIRIQFAADAEWPYTVPANAPVRREFQLPMKRPFTVKVPKSPTP